MLGNAASRGVQRTLGLPRPGPKVRHAAAEFLLGPLIQAVSPLGGTDRARTAAARAMGAA